jgi:DNA invertase Pin-like site-specific DNA recombinase
MIYGYARVSTKGQAKDGNSLESQEKALREAGAIKIFKDSFTGTKTDRPEFTKLVDEVLQEGDTLIVTKLDRFARSMSQGSQLVTELINRGIKVHILNIGMMDNSPSSKLIRNIFFAFAEFERDMIVERTTEGKEAAKVKAEIRGEKFKEGRPQKYDAEQLEYAYKLLENNSYSKVTKITGIGKSTLIRYRRGKEQI